mgnify:CR=1 FL=1
MKAWLELFRISNLPTVWSNIIAGAAISWVLFGNQLQLSAEYILALVVIMLGGSCLYSGGMVLNDVFDLDVDLKERPQRPIPSGRISLLNAKIAGWLLLVAGIALVWITHPNDIWPVACAGMIAACSVVYNLIHNRTKMSVVLMGICRALLYPMGAVGLVGTGIFASEQGGAEYVFLILFSFASCVHTIAFSLVARQEMSTVRNQSDRLFAAATFSLCVPFSMLTIMMLLFVGTEYSTSVWPSPMIPVLVGLLVLSGWLVRNYRLLLKKPPRTTGFILGSIAAFCLYDAAICMLLPPRIAFLTMIPLGLFFIVRAGHRRIPGT